MQALEHQIVDFLTQLMQSIGWPGVVVIMALESANIPIPSELTMPLAGWLLVQARGGTAFQAVWQGGLYGAVGCTIGSVVSYWLGAWGGRPLLERYGGYLFIRHSDLEQADRWFARWGDWAAFISRLLPIVRTFISFPAGVTRMRFSTSPSIPSSGRTSGVGRWPGAVTSLANIGKSCGRSCAPSTCPSASQSWRASGGTSIDAGG